MMSDDAKQENTEQGCETPTQKLCQFLEESLEIVKSLEKLAFTYPANNEVQSIFESSRKQFESLTTLFSFNPTEKLEEKINKLKDIQKEFQDFKQKVEKLKEDKNIKDDISGIQQLCLKSESSFKEFIQYSSEQFQSLINSLNVAEIVELEKNFKELGKPYPTYQGAIEQQINDTCKLKNELKKHIENAKKYEQEMKSLKQNQRQEGLVKHYKEKSKDLYKYQERWTWTILGGLAVLLCLGIYNYFTKQETNSLEHLFHLLSIFPAYLALIWFIIFASRRRNEISRLSNDYSHKAVFASSYLAYQEEIKELRKSDETTQLKIKLLDSMIDTLADNPAKSLDNKKASDEFPAKEIINFASEIIKLKDSKGGK